MPRLLSCSGRIIRTTLLGVALAPAGSVLGQVPVADRSEEEERVYVFRYRAPARPWVEGLATHADDHDPRHGHGGLSETEYEAAIEETKRYWRELTSSGSVELAATKVIELYRRARHFSVVHALLSDGTISEEHSRVISEIRAEIHGQVIDALAESGRFGHRLGVNDFGTVGNAKSDIDFTLYARGHPGSELVKAYRALFKRLTGLDPAQLDIVAHHYEAVIPDWRADVALADFETRIRRGMRALKPNPEAYFLEGAYHQQVMGRSAEGETLTWHEPLPDGRIRRSSERAATSPDFFYFRPDTRARYAWGGAVGNWHFYHSHAGKRANQAKYLLRSVDDGARLSQLTEHQARNYRPFESLSRGERLRVVQELYGARVTGDVLVYFAAVMETAANLRAARADVGSAYEPLLALERAKAPHPDELLLLRRAKASMDRYGAALLMENNVMTASGRLQDWLAPPVAKGRYRTFDDQGRPRTIEIDDAALKRLQFSAFFELEAGMELLDRQQIDRIKRENPRFARDIEILEGIIEKKREMIAPADYDGADPRAYRTSLAREILSDFQRLDRVAAEGGPRRFFAGVGGTAWRRTSEFEDWLQRSMVDSMARVATGGNRAAVERLSWLRESTQTTNELLVDSRVMLALDGANSILEVLKVWVREGELNANVRSLALQEFLSFLPGGGTLYQIRSGAPGIVTLVSTQVVPGYGPLLLTLQIAKSGVELAGLTVFEPLRDDRIQMAYQGYLDAESGGLFSSGQKERVDKVTSVLKMVDPSGTLPLDQRRRRIYRYFHDDISATIDKDPEFPYTEDEWPHEWLQQEIRWLEVRIRQHVLDWWHARGLFAGDDGILAFRAKTLGAGEEEFRRELEQRLWRDYWAGRQIHQELLIRERAKSYEELEELMAQIAATEAGIERLGDLPDHYSENGEIVYAEMLSGMPELPTSMEILVTPRVETLELGEPYPERAIEGISGMSLRAKLYASAARHPQPWSITWAVENGAERTRLERERSSSESERQVGTAVGAWPVTVTAVARDVDNREIARRSVELQVEKVEIEGATEREKREAPPQTTERTDERDGADSGVADEIVESARAAVAAATAASGGAVAACEATRATAESFGAEMIELPAAMAQLAARLKALGAAIDRLSDLGRSVTASAERAKAAAEDLARLRDESLSIRDRACASPPDGTGRARILPILHQAGRAIDAIRDAVEEARDAHDRAGAVAEEAAALDATLQELSASKDNARSLLEGVRAAADRARARARRAQELASSASALVASALVELPPRDPGEARLLSTLHELRSRLGAELASAQQCQADSEQRLAEIGQIDGNLEARWSALVSGLEALRRSQTAGAGQRAIGAAFAEADVILSIAEPFFESIGNRASDAETCLRDDQGWGVPGGDAEDRTPDVSSTPLPEDVTEAPASRERIPPQRPEPPEEEASTDGWGVPGGDARAETSDVASTPLPPRDEEIGSAPRRDSAGERIAGVPPGPRSDAGSRRLPDRPPAPAPPPQPAQGEIGPQSSGTFGCGENFRIDSQSVPVTQEITVPYPYRGARQVLCPLRGGGGVEISWFEAPPAAQNQQDFQDFCQNRCWGGRPGYPHNSGRAVCILLQFRAGSLTSSPDIEALVSAVASRARSCSGR